MEQSIDESPVDLSRIKQKKIDDFEFEVPENWRLAHLEAISNSIPFMLFTLETSMPTEFIQIPPVLCL